MAIALVLFPYSSTSFSTPRSRSDHRSPRAKVWPNRSRSLTMIRRFLFTFSALGIAALATWNGNISIAQALQLASAQGDDQVAEEGVEVLARGPIHEAFAQPLTGKPEPSPIVDKKPPEPIEELPPEAK